MIIGVPEEVKNNEFRVALTTSGVHELVRNGHTVLVQNGAGTGSGISDAEFALAGAELLGDPGEIWARSEIVVKVKEPVSSEYGYFRKGLVLFTYLHLAAEPELTRALMDSGVTAIAYETVQVGRFLPLLAPMSAVAGRLSVQVGAQYLTPRLAERACSWEGFRVFAQPMWPSWERGSLAPRPRPWPLAPAPT